MISVEEAAAKIRAAASPLPSEVVALGEAHGRVLAADQAARRTQPPLAVSAMDGYAVRAADVAAVPAVLRVLGSVPAGGRFAGTVDRGAAVRIFTGAPLPDGTDAIVIQEDTDADPAAGTVAVREGAPAGRHVRPAGLDFREGDVCLRAGRRLTARDIALAAAMNLPWLPVRRRPRVALLATGDEIVRPGEPLGSAQIVGSSGPALAAFVRGCGGEPHDIGIARDSLESLRECSAGAAGSDVLVTMGGASVGDHDLVQEALAGQGLDIDFWRIAMRPGKPLMFGRLGSTLVLGLPGNPVSSMVCAVLFLAPLIGALLGLPAAGPHRLPARLGAPLGTNDNREDYLRARLAQDGSGEFVAMPFDVQDSSMLSRLAAAECLIVRAPHAPALAAGERVFVLPLEPFGTIA